MSRSNPYQDPLSQQLSHRHHHHHQREDEGEEWFQYDDEGDVRAHGLHVVEESIGGGSSGGGSGGSGGSGGGGGGGSSSCSSSGGTGGGSEFEATNSAQPASSASSRPQRRLRRTHTIAFTQSSESLQQLQQQHQQQLQQQHQQQLQQQTTRTSTVAAAAVGDADGGLLSPPAPVPNTIIMGALGRQRRSSHDPILVSSSNATSTGLIPQQNSSNHHRNPISNSSSLPRKFLIDVEKTQSDILRQEDTDGNFQITVQDTGPKVFSLGSVNSEGYKRYDIRGHYMLSNLLQELAIAQDYGRKYIILGEDRLNENPVDRLSRRIKYHFWDALTRRIDAEGLENICRDPKNRSKDQQNRILVPFLDTTAYAYFSSVALDRPHLRLDVVKLPPVITPEYVKSIDFHPGILSLGLRMYTDSVSGEQTLRGTPFVVPGGRFNEMYGWDSYFEVLGLLVDERIELSRGMVENFVYEIQYYGKILNANRSYYLSRSQPPFLTDMLIRVYKALTIKASTPPPLSKTPSSSSSSTTRKYTSSQPLRTTTDLKKWLAHGTRAAIKEYFAVWKSAPRLDPVVGLSKYRTQGIGMPPETESCHFNHILRPFAEKHGFYPAQSSNSPSPPCPPSSPPHHPHNDEEEDEDPQLSDFKRKYWSGEIKEPELDEYFIHDRAVRESGHDTTYRFEGCCANLATVDLNSLLYKYECDLASLIGKEFDGSVSVKVINGPDNIYLNSFLAWIKLLEDKGGVDRAIGNMGGWDASWANGIQVFEEAVSASNQSCKTLSNNYIPVWSPCPPPEEHLRSSNSNNTKDNHKNELLSSSSSTSPPINYTSSSSSSSSTSFIVTFTSSALFSQLSKKTRSLMTQYLWNSDAGLFFDFDCHTMKQSNYETATCLWTLWAGAASPEQATIMVPVALEKFEADGGIVSGTEESRGRVGLDRPNRQWDYPFGWAPHQILAWRGLADYGYDLEMRRLAYKWLYMITRSFVDFNGVVPEKFDVVNLSHNVNVEYGNVGTDFKCVVREGFGWMNASYQLGLQLLSVKERRALGTLTTPKALFSS